MLYTGVLKILFLETNILCAFFKLPSVELVIASKNGKLTFLKCLFIY